LKYKEINSNLNFEASQGSFEISLPHPGNSWGIGGINDPPHLKTQTQTETQKFGFSGVYAISDATQ
jgi:hypothetical protein